MIARQQALSLGLVLLLLVGGVLGGGQTTVVLPMFIELFSCGLLVFAVPGIIDGRYPRPALAVLVLLALALIIPLLQLVPLPVAFWSGLPGHGIPDAISRLAGLGSLWRPLSLTPEQTKLGALTLIVPITAFITSLQLTSQSRDQVILAIVAFAFLSAVIGVFQVAAGGFDLGIYLQVHDGYPIGFFANRNHEADLLLIGMPAAVYVIRSRHMKRQTTNLATLSALAFFSLSVVATQSRFGLLLLPVSIGIVAIIWYGRLSGREIWTVAAALVVLLIVGFLAISFTPIGHRVIARFGDVGDDLRPHIWQGTIAAIRSFWPTGSGVGSFVPVYAMFEDLNSVRPEWVNHAHNDYLEVVLEAGLAGVIMICAYFLILVVSILRRMPDHLRRQKFLAVGGILILLLHSLADYPLRTFALSIIFAFLNALLFAPSQATRVRRSGSHPAEPQPSFARLDSHA